jgi:hypothetical protein
MRVEGEILRAQVLSGFVIGVVIEEDGPENRALGVYARGQCADAVIGRGQEFVYLWFSRNKIPRNRFVILLALSL